MRSGAGFGLARIGAQDNHAGTRLGLRISGVKKLCRAIEIPSRGEAVASKTKPLSLSPLGAGVSVARWKPTPRVPRPRLCCQRADLIRR
ncbi:MAG: hypothetical protein R2693_07625 [Nocardioidaceae bacterium]